MPIVKDLMTTDVITIDPQKTAFEAAQLMSDHGIGDLIIMDKEVPIGIITERDFVRRIVAKKRPLDTKISEIMSKPLLTIDADASIREAARKMVSYKIRRLLVMKDDKLVGIITASDFARQLSKKTITEDVLKAIGRYPLSEVLDRETDVGRMARARGSRK